MNQKLVDRYIEVARALRPKRQNGRSFHITCIFDKRKLLSIGVNDYTKDHPRHKYGVYLPTKPGFNYTSGIHSECRAIEKLVNTSYSKLKVLNIRIDNNGEVNLSKPCLNCEKLIKKLGFKRVFYTTKDGLDVLHF